jgi:hypothetical protein
MAQDQPHIEKGDLLFDVDPTKSVYASKGGKVGVPDRILTQNMITSTSPPTENLKQWIKNYDFHYAHLQIGANPDEGYMPQYVKIAGEMNPEMPTDQRPIVQHIFPATVFVNKNYSIDGDFVASASTGFQHLQSFATQSDASIKGELKITFKYNPTIPVIDSAATGNSFYWNFRKNGNRIPIGGLDLHIIIARPRKISAMNIQWIISVNYKKKVMGSDKATTKPMLTDLIFNESSYV